MHNFEDVERAVEEMKRVSKKREGKRYFVVSVLKKAKDAGKIISLLKVVVANKNICLKKKNQNQSAK